MRVNIGRIKGIHGASMDVAFSVDNLSGADLGHEAKLIAPVAVQATITNTGRCYLVRGEVRTVVDLVCGRCLTSYEMPVVAPLEEEYFPQAENRGRAAVHEAETLFAEQSTFTGDIIDLTEAVREQTELALPYKALCKQDCSGLCVVCGKNLNIGECGCQRETIDPRFADLSRLLNGSQDSSGKKSTDQ